ncbi:hypothetical protein [Phenylobacterium sp.]|uniref:hypothetical protein n=1 Tax=Phenylobacterium sp. TaxID=1871053 RepID=UPI002FCC87C6
MLRCLAIVVAVSVGSPSLAAACAPKDMVRVGSFNATPGLDPASDATKPRTIHRLGKLFARIDEGPDPANRMHRLTVIREPDIWTANRFDKTGQHVLDPGPVFEVHAPLFQGPGLPTLFRELELGCELDFIDAYAPKPHGKVGKGPMAFIRHQLTIGDHRIEILLKPVKPGAPRKVYSVGLYVKDQPRSVIQYLAYDVGLPADMSLFERPKGIKYVEVSASAPTPPKP